MKINGDKITAAEFFQVEYFKNGIAKVELGNVDKDGALINETYKTGYINMSGKYIWKPTR
jgi:hypothetical protein